MRRVVVTGLGAVTPIGLNTDDFWDAIKKNTVGINTITSFDSSEYKAHLAAEESLEQAMQLTVWISRLQGEWKSSASMQ